MDKVLRAIVIILNVLVFIISVAACVVIVSVCRQGFIPDGQDMLYGSSLLGWLFSLVSTLYIDVRTLRQHQDC